MYTTTSGRSSSMGLCMVVLMWMRILEPGTVET
jgi:hypothetical protein